MLDCNTLDKSETVCVFLATIVSVFAAAGVCVAQPVMIDASACIEIDSVIERLDCFDRQAEVALGAVTADARDSDALDVDTLDTAGLPEAEATPPPPSGVESAALEAQFGLPESTAQERAAIDELESEVSALREIQPGRLEITLANGQVWRQANSDRYRLQVGHNVRVYSTRFGRLFRLTAPALRGFIQVERVR